MGKYIVRGVLVPERKAYGMGTDVGQIRPIPWPLSRYAPVAQWQEPPITNRVDAGWSPARRT